MRSTQKRTVGASQRAGGCKVPPAVASLRSWHGSAWRSVATSPHLRCGRRTEFTPAPRQRKLEFLRLPDFSPARGEVLVKRDRAFRPRLCIIRVRRASTLVARARVGLPARPAPRCPRDGAPDREHARTMSPSELADRGTRRRRGDQPLRRVLQRPARLRGRSRPRAWTSGRSMRTD